MLWRQLSRLNLQVGTCCQSQIPVMRHSTAESSGSLLTDGIPQAARHLWSPGLMHRLIMSDDGQKMAEVP